MIALETSRQRPITNFQGSGVSPMNLNWARDLTKIYPNAISRTAPSGVYNCHGLTFASRRTSLEESAQIPVILDDDKYVEIGPSEVLAGDVIVYYDSDGEPNHSGIVVGVKGELKLPIICSKWGSAGEFVHRMGDCPPHYGPRSKFYRCRL